MTYQKDTDSLDREGAKTIGMIGLSLAVTGLLFAFMESVPAIPVNLPDFDPAYLTLPLVWLFFGMHIAAITGLAAFLIRCVTQKISRDVLIAGISGISGVLLAAYSLKRLSAASCSCSICTGNAHEALSLFVPPLLGVAVLYLVRRGIAAVRTAGKGRAS